MMILERLWDSDISISSGELSYLLTQGHNDFHAEKDERLMTGIDGSHHLQTDDTGARASSQKVLVQCKLHVCSLSFHTMNFLSSVTSARHDHPGQRVLKYFSRFQQQNALLEEILDLSQKENTLQRELTVRPPASLHGHHYEPTLQTFRNYLTDRLMGIGLFPKSARSLTKFLPWLSCGLSKASV